jgi:hypothetical protein
VAGSRHQAAQVVVCAVSVVLGVLGLGSTAPVALPAGTPSQREAVLTLLDSLPAPQGATRDPSATACGVPTRFCISDVDGSRARVAEAVVDLLRAKGARLVGHHCTRSAGCADRLVLDGVGVVVRSGDTALGAGDVSVPPYVAVSFPLGDLAVPVGAPLPSLRLLGLPAPVDQVPCRERRGAGCMRYDGSWPGTATAETVAGAWRTRLLQLGYRLSDDRCETVAVGAQRCTVAAERFRTFGGQDPVEVVLMAQDRAGGVLTMLDVQTSGARS